MTEKEMREKMADYVFYHTIRLTDNLTTAGWKPAQMLQQFICRCIRSVDVRGKRVLDIGCRDGLMSFEAERAGAAEVIAIDSDMSKAAVEFVAPALKSKVRFQQMNLLDLRPDTFGLFDIVIFPGVLYHLRYPFWALRLVRDLLKPGSLLILETAIRIDDNQHALLYCPIGAESDYEPTSCTFFNRKGMLDTLHSLGLETAKTDSHNEPHGANHGTSYGSLDRIVFTCRYNPAIIDREVTRYWDGTHEIHTARAGMIYSPAVPQGAGVESR
jgi:SAM-dependent methyltransferase